MDLGGDGKKVASHKHCLGFLEDFFYLHQLLYFSQLLTHTFILYTTSIELLDRKRTDITPNYQPTDSEKSISSRNITLQLPDTPVVIRKKILPLYTISNRNKDVEVQSSNEKEHYSLVSS